MRLTTAPSSASCAQADRTIPVAVRIAGAGASPQAVGALLLRSSDGAVVPLSALANVEVESGRSLIDHDDGLRRQVVTVNPTTSNQTGFAEAARQRDRRAGETAGRRLPTLWRCGRGTGRRSASAVSACRGGVGADRAADGAGVRSCAARGAGAAGAAEHADRRCRRLGDHRRDVDSRGDGGLRGAVRHGRAQHHTAGLALQPPGAGRRPDLGAGNRAARVRGAADARVADRAHDRARAAAGGDPAASARPRDRRADGGGDPRRPGVVDASSACCWCRRWRHAG